MQQNSPNWSKWAKQGQTLAFSLLKSTPVKKKYTTNGCVVGTNISYDCYTLFQPSTSCCNPLLPLYLDVTPPTVTRYCNTPLTPCYTPVTPCFNPNTFCYTLLQSHHNTFHPCYTPVTPYCTLFNPAYTLPINRSGMPSALGLV